MPINTFVVKVASRCNLNCSYCYMYNMGDNTYMKQPKFMSIDTVIHFAQKLKRYCNANDLKCVYISFHGGEPLLASKQFYKDAVYSISSIMDGVDVIYVMQTNGTLLDEEWCQLLNQLNIQAGISIDGPKEKHDIFRVYHDNKGSFDEVVKGINLRNTYGIGGVISVINIAISPEEFYAFYKSLNSPVINILLPDGHFENFPPRFEFFYNPLVTPYGDWLIELYNHWRNDRDENKPVISFFENIVGMILGLDKGDELIGKRKNGAICIETDGSIEVVDPLRICGEGFTRNNLNVASNEISDILSLPLFDLFYNSHTILCNKCDACSVKDICGGGYLAHRYSKHNGFDNPSIYCKDLMKLITYIQNSIISDLPKDVISELEIDRLTYHEALTSIEENKILNNLSKDFLISFKE